MQSGDVVRILWLSETCLMVVMVDVGSGYHGVGSASSNATPSHRAFPCTRHALKLLILQIVLSQRLQLMQITFSTTILDIAAIHASRPDLAHGFAPTGSLDGDTSTNRFH